MGLGRDRAGHLGTEAFEFFLGDIAAHALQRAGQHPGLPGQRQAFDGFFLAAPVHAEVLELGFDGAGALCVCAVVEEVTDRLGLFLRQCLTHVQPVGADDGLQRTEPVRQFLRSTRPYRRNVQFVYQPFQRGAGSELGAQLALVLQLQTAFTEQRIDNATVVLVLKEAVNLVSDFQADIRQVGQYFRQGLFDTLQRRQRTRQDLGRLFTHIGNAQRINEARQGRLSAVGDGLEQLVAGDFREAFQVDDLFVFQLVQIGRRADEFLIDQLLDGLVTQPFDVHGATRHVMDDRLLELRTAGQTPDTAIHRALGDSLLAFAALDQLRALDMRAAHRAGLRNLHCPGILGAALGNHLHHLRNHVTGTPDDHRVADHQPQPRHFVHVVQRGIGDHDACHLDRLEACDRRDGAGTTHLELDIQQFGELFHGGEFVGNRPARLTGAEAKFALRCQVVDLEHHAVDLVSQRQAPLTDIAVIGQALLDAIRHFQLATDRHAPFFQRFKHADVSVGDFRRRLAQTIAAELQRPVGRDLGIQLTQAACGCVARVGEGLAADFQLTGVKPLETGLGHEHFTAHFQHVRPALALQLERDVTHCAHVDADVFAGGSVAACRAPHQRTVAIQQADGQTVQLGLAAVLHLAAFAKQVPGRQIQPLGDPPIEFEHVVFFERVAQAEHRHFVTHLGERRQGRASDPLRRRIRGDQMGVFRLQGLELVKQAVVLDIRNARFIQNVVAVVVLIQLCTQFQDSGFDGLHTVFSQKAKKQPRLLNLLALFCSGQAPTGRAAARS